MSDLDNLLASREMILVAGSGGVVRVGIAHYNTVEEVDRLLEVLRGSLL